MSLFDAFSTSILMVVPLQFQLLSYPSSSSFCNNGLIICCFLFYRLQCDMLIFSVYLIDQGKNKFTSLIKEK